MHLAEPDRDNPGVSATDLDDGAFTTLVESHRRELQVHCYRMLGSFDDSEDLVQETYLRAWRKRHTFQGRSTARAWLYRIATNACLDYLDTKSRMPIVRRQPALGMDAASAPSGTEVMWLQPFPDRLLDQVAPPDAEPETQVITKETIELAVMVAIQHLPPQQRAVLALRDLAGWSAAETAAALSTSVASVNSALQRARATMRQHLPARRAEWAADTDPSEAERLLLQQCVDALQEADPHKFARLLREDVKVTMPPDPLWFFGKDTFVGGLMAQFDQASPMYFGTWKAMATRANRQPAVAGYVRPPGADHYRAQVLNVFRLEDGVIAEITAFGSEVFDKFGLPPVLER